MNSIVTRRLVIALAALIAAGVAGRYVVTPSTTPNELRVLAWVGYEEDDLVQAFSKDTGINLKVRTAASGDAVVAMLAAQPKDFDVIILDPEYIQKLAPTGAISPVQSEAVDWTGIPKIVQDCRTCRFDGKLYGVPLRFGANGLVYNSEKFSKDEVASLQVLWSEKAKGRVGLFDWYLPNMGLMSLAAGNGTSPYDIDEDQLARTTAEMQKLRPNVRSFFSSPRDLLSALASGEIWIVPIGGESFTGLLRGDGKPIDWTIPEEGGIRWTESALIPSSNTNPEMAMRYINWMLSPSGQKLLATRRAYYGFPVNSLAIAQLPKAVKDVFHVANGDDVVRIYSQLRTRQLPQKQPPSEWQDIWEQFKAVGSN
ncbi:MAG: extracellular solute-binding protein [Alphaproteobacteria bacterium]|nr:extracellular solute-binding protein [Alphaproteobacteria bacterium]